jgi:hypothetical protein
MEVGQGPNWGCSAKRKKNLNYHKTSKKTNPSFQCISQILVYIGHKIELTRFMIYPWATNKSNRTVFVYIYTISLKGCGPSVRYMELVQIINNI